ncbi:MAG: FIST C-terminal domain-containing protein [Candidatus Polarisedimenticolaceae bacterium]|nr:FIST C-terminal domain-containing protein [Candidatus Polarisedimenticolaceae bacterium]
MTSSNTQYVRRAEVICQNPDQAVKQLKDALYLENMAGVVFFCSDSYDPDILTIALKAHFNCPIVGCTTAGEIGSTYLQGGIVGISFSSDHFCLHSTLINELDKFNLLKAKSIAENLESQLNFSDALNTKEMFGLFLIDGLSNMEEPLIATLHTEMNGISIVGGSAGDSLKFSETRVYDGHSFSSAAAIFILIESKLPFQTFQLQNFEPSDIDMVITRADPQSRTVYEIDGGNAAEEYAAILGLKIEALSSHTFASHPLMLQIGDEWYIRSIQKVNKDGSLTFYCAIDEGLPLTIAKGVGFITALNSKTTELNGKFSQIICTIGFDCVLRKIELLESGKKEEVEALLRALNFIGFSTFGEQIDAIHVNQTLTGVVIGECLT